MQADPGRRVAERVSEAIRRRLPDVTIILFGSRAEGSALKESDIDLVVVSDQFRRVEFVKRPSLLLRALREEGVRVGVGLDILCYTHEEFERKRREIGVVREAALRGVILRSKGEELPARKSLTR